jgi:hypothetical protein
MKLLLSMLIKRGTEHPWWELRSSEGDPPSERVGWYVITALLSLVKSKLERAKHETPEKID